MRDEEQQAVFDALMSMYGLFDYVVCTKYGTALRYRCYHDGAWLEGHDVEPVIYWGA